MEVELDEEEEQEEEVELKQGGGEEEEKECWQNYLEWWCRRKRRRRKRRRRKESQMNWRNKSRRKKRNERNWRRTRSGRRIGGGADDGHWLAGSRLKIVQRIRCALAAGCYCLLPTLQQWFYRDAASPAINVATATAGVDETLVPHYEMLCSWWRRCWRCHGGVMWRCHVTPDRNKPPAAANRRWT